MGVFHKFELLFLSSDGVRLLWSAERAMSSNLVQSRQSMRPCFFISRLLPGQYHLASILQFPSNWQTSTLRQLETALLTAPAKSLDAGGLSDPNQTCCEPFVIRHQHFHLIRAPSASPLKRFVVAKSHSQVAALRPHRCTSPMSLHYDTGFSEIHKPGA